MSDRLIEDAVAKGIDRIVVPPESDWLPNPSHGKARRWGFRLLGVVPALAIILVVATVAGVQLRAARDRVQTGVGDSPPASPAAQPSNQPGAIEQAQSLYVLDLGAGPGQPGVTPGGPRNLTADAITSFAVDDDWIYLWDSATERLLLIELRQKAAAPHTRLQIPLALTGVPPKAVGLLVYRTNEWYLRTEQADGTIVQQFHVVIRDASRGPEVSGTPAGYPRERPSWMGLAVSKGQSELLGRDTFGNRYERVPIPSGVAIDQSVEIRRIRESDGQILAIDRRPPARGQDLYVSESGGVYELRWDDAVPPRTVEIVQLLAPVARPTACPSVIPAAVPPPGLTLVYPTRTAAEVRVGLANDPNFRHTLEDIAGVRQDSNPLRDSGVPRCAVDALTVGEPVSVRRYPDSAGTWYVPVLYQGRQVMLVTVGRARNGLGASGGSIGGGAPFPAMSEATALQVAGSSTDRAVSAELVFARVSGREMVAWRVIRQSGSVFYVFPEVPGGGPNGLILPESQVQVGS